MIRRNMVPIFVILLIFLFILNPSTVSEGAFNGLKLWVTNIIPLLFPMSVLSNILLRYNFIYKLFDRYSYVSVKVLKNKYALIPMFISFVSGYPSGAMTVNTMYLNKRLNMHDANYLLKFTNNCSFQFIAGVICFSMLKNFNLYVFIAIPHFLGSIILSFILSNTCPGKSSSLFTKKNMSFNEAFSDSIYKSIMSMLSVGGVIVVFSVISNFINLSLLKLSHVLSINSYIKDVIYSLIVGSLEFVNGCNIISSADVSLQAKLIILNFLISFSGLSVIFQTIAVSNDCEIKLHTYMFYKFILGVISSFLCVLMLIIFL